MRQAILETTYVLDDVWVRVHLRLFLLRRVVVRPPRVVVAHGLSLLRQLREDARTTPPPVAPEEEAIDVYCPLISGVCQTQHCGTCGYLHVDRPGKWVCAQCAESFKALPFWTDGRCDACGRTSILLIRATQPSDQEISLTQRLELVRPSRSSD